MSAELWLDETWEPSKLKPHPRNPNTHPPEQIAQLRAAIRSVGFTRSVIATHEGVICAGHGAVIAALAEGVAEVPVRRRNPEHPLTPTQELALLVGDNRIPENAEWNDAELAAIVAELRAEDYPLDAVGFTLADVDALLASLAGAGGAGGGGGGATTPGAGSLAARFLVPPFSVLNAREGWWQERKANWIALGIRSEIGRGANLIGRSPQDNFSHMTGIPYHEARDIVAAAMAERGEAFDVDVLIEEYLGRKPGGASFGRSGAVMPVLGSGSVKQQFLEMRGYAGGTDKLAPGGTGKNSAWLRKGEDGYKPTPGGINGEERDNYQIGPEGSPNATFTRVTAADPQFYEQKREVEAKLGHELTTAEFIAEYYVAPDTAVTSAGTSIFDPVLCEIAYRWFAPAGGRVLDPFAGGSVRGIVAAKVGLRYAGVELRREQIAANYEQARDILGPGADAVEYHEGDACELAAEWFAEPFDLLFTCPPYFDLERYSDDPRDLSNMDYKKFRAALRATIKRAASMLREDRFAIMVVGEVRDRKTGNYRGLVPDTIAAFEAAGLAFYNEAILVTAVGSLPIRVGRIFSSTRKLGKTHQNVLVFVKGDAVRAAAACGTVDVAEPEQEQAPREPDAPPDFEALLPLGGEYVGDAATGN